MQGVYSFAVEAAGAARVQHLFALSTHTMQWFVERGFTQCSLQDLPERRVALYNHGRASKIYIKPLMVCARAARPCHARRTRPCARAPHAPAHTHTHRSTEALVRPRAQSTRLLDAEELFWTDSLSKQGKANSGG